VDRLITAAAEQSELTRVSTSFRVGVPQLHKDVDRAKVLSMPVPLGDLFSTLQAALGSAYVNDFNKFGRTYRVSLQANAQFRDNVDDVRRLNVRNAAGDMVSLGSLMTIEESFGPQVIRRFNLYPSANVTGSAAPGQRSGQALQVMKKLAKREFPDTIGFEWSGVILVVPLGLLGTVAAISWMAMDNNTYVQIGVVLIVSPVSKNAILIVEFAWDLRMQGKSITEAAVEASRMRFRPLRMTSFASISGVLPLLFAEGAAAASRRSLGTAVCGGIVTSTILAIFFTPVFYLIFQWLSERFTRKSDGDEGQEAQPKVVA